jgi:hypothetical protein
MAIKAGSMPGTIHSTSYEMLTTPDGTELCEDCAAECIKQGAYTEAELRPIFAHDEMDREATCDVCGVSSDLHTIL